MAPHTEFLTVPHSAVFRWRSVLAVPGWSVLTVVVRSEPAPLRSPLVAPVNTALVLYPNRLVSRTLANGRAALDHRFRRVGKPRDCYRPGARVRAQGAHR